MPSRQKTGPCLCCNAAPAQASKGLPFGRPTKHERTSFLSALSGGHSKNTKHFFEALFFDVNGVLSEKTFVQAVALRICASK